MIFWKLLAYVNWGLISLYGALVFYMLVQMGSGMGHEMKDMGTVLKGVAVCLLLAFVGLNRLPYLWTKITALILMSLLFLLIYVFVTD